MIDPFFSEAKSDFAQARLKAFWRRIVNFVSGQPSRLLSYEEVKEKLRIGGPIYRGVQSVEVNKIIGSLNRYHQFDRAFLPLEDRSASRWESIDRAFYQDIQLPPIVLYKVGDVYFVVDGHHRVSVAREKGVFTIDAEVRECSSKVNITPDINPEDLEILGEKVTFLERSNLDQLRPGSRIRLTIPDGFDRMLEHIAVHRYFMGLDQQRDIPEQEAVSHWYDTVYMPIILRIRRSGILRVFPGKTEGDLYLWVLDRQRYLNQQGKKMVPPGRAAKEFLEEVE